MRGGDGVDALDPRGVSGRLGPRRQSEFRLHRLQPDAPPGAERHGADADADGAGPRAGPRVLGRRLRVQQPRPERQRQPDAAQHRRAARSADHDRIGQQQQQHQQQHQQQQQQQQQQRRRRQW